MACLPDHVETPRLVLRLWQPADGPALHRAVTASLEHLRPWMPWIAQEPLTEADRGAKIGQWRQDWFDGGDAIYGVFADGVPVGGTGLHRRIGDGGLEIGYWIHVDHVGQGYATELARALTGAALTQPGIDRVEIQHDQANIISGRVPQRLGFRHLGAVDKVALAPAETGVSWVWRMTPADWSADLRLA
jgi:RimJ/RimL family protein N-acetyltransferase